MAVLNQMKLLISLAQIDGKVADREQNYIINIGRANGFYPDEIKPLFDKQHKLAADQKFNYIVSLVQLMKIDERMYKEEIMFCSKIAVNLGYDQGVMFDLMLHVKADMSESEMRELRSITDKHLLR
jgi:hypothetical protein